MELLVAGGLAGMGLLLNEKKDSNIPNNHNNIYNNKIVTNHESKLVNNNFNNINSPQIISRCHNRSIMKNENNDFIYSKLSGQPIEKNKFKHNNMQPFFGGSVKQNVNNDSNSILLEKYTGSNIQNKKEVDSMFKPQVNMGNVNGFSNNPDNTLSLIHI